MGFENILEAFYSNNEKGRKAGYKQIKNLKKMLYVKAEKLIDENDLFSG